MQVPSDFFNQDAQAGGFFPLAHVGIDVANFARHQNTLIEGIRGTGKTHILRMLELENQKTFKKNRVLPVYVSLAEIGEHTKKGPDIFRLYLHAHIVDRTVETLEQARDTFAEDPSIVTAVLTKIARLFHLRPRDNFDELLADIKKTTTELKHQLQFGITSQTLKNLVEHGREETTQFTLNPVKWFGAMFSSKDSSKDANEKSVSFVGKQLYHENASHYFLSFVRSIQDILNLDSVLVLVDECSEAIPDSQVEVFRLFKTIRGARSSGGRKGNCAYFIGTVYPRGETNYPSKNTHGFSFQPGQDCTMEYLEYDETDLDSYLGFYRELLLSRVRNVLGLNYDFSRTCRELFDEIETFTLVALLANGIPRRFWEILKQAYTPATGMITLKSADIAVHQVTNDLILSPSHLADVDFMMLERISNALNQVNVETRGHNNQMPKNTLPQTVYFGIKRGKESNVQRLIGQGVIHDKARTRNAKKIARPEPIYSLDLAVVYVNKVIPVKNFAPTLRSDIPLCISGDFQQSPIFKNISAISNFLENEKTEKSRQRQTSSDDEIERIEVSVQAQRNHVIRKDLVSTVKYIDYNKGRGYIVSAADDDYGFLKDDVHGGNFEHVRPEDEVLFDTKLLSGKEYATNVRVRKRAEPRIGRIVLVNSILGGLVECSVSGEQFKIHVHEIDGLAENQVVRFFVNNALHERHATKVSLN